MSEHQFYEFRAIDRALTEKEMRTLRAHSTRARITSTSFVNDYTWSDFRGNEDAWIHRYFDAFLYMASWGKRALKLRLPGPLVELDDARRYLTSRAVTMREKNGHVVVAFTSELDRGGESKGDGKLSAVIQVRAALARADLRSLYLGWLLGVQTGEIDDDELEPPVPIGLGQLDPAHLSLCDFLGLDPDLVAVAARISRPIEEVTPPPVDVRAWIAEMEQSEKDELLETLLVSEDPTTPTRVVQRLRKEHGLGSDRDPAPRTAGELRAAARQAGEERRLREQEALAREAARREREAEEARSLRLAELAGKEPVVWSEVEALIATRQSKSYDHAVQLLVDLRDLAAQQGESSFSERVQSLYAAHLGKPSLIDRMQRAGL